MSLPLPLLILLTPALYIAVGLVLGRLASHMAYKSKEFVDHEAAAITWLWLTLLFWPVILAGALVFYLIVGLVHVVHRVALTEEAR